MDLLCMLINNQENEKCPANIIIVKIDWYSIATLIEQLIHFKTSASMEVGIVKSGIL